MSEKVVKTDQNLLSFKKTLDLGVLKHKKFHGEVFYQNAQLLFLVKKLAALGTIGEDG
jgi:hypothetical protein